MRRECLDYLIPLTEAHLRRILKGWVAYYNRSRPHSALGPGVPDPPTEIERHQIGKPFRVIAKPVLGGLHHDYALESL
jgi:hypothetical protein